MPPVKIPTSIPAIFYAGDSLYFTVSNSDYPASEGWIMSYVFSSGGPDKIQSIAPPSGVGGDHLFNVIPDTTEDWPSGDFTWRSYVTKTTQTGTSPDIVISTEQYPVSTGTISIRYSDYQSVAKKKIDAIEAYLSNTSSYADYEWTMKSLGDMSVSRGGDPRKNAREDLVYWKSIYAAEIQKEKLNNGQETGDRTIWARFIKN